MHPTRLITLLLLLLPSWAVAQQVDVEQPFGIGEGKAWKLSGGVAANTVFFSSNRENSREPFTYFLQGNMALGFYGLSMPLSFSYSNQGSNLGYQLPFNFNRLSLHPKYKWIQGHIGDVAMSFSPYTLNAFQFTGGGVELSPEGRWKFAAMGGRLLKATEDDGNPQTLPAFRRMGYGAKVSYTHSRFGVGITGFYAKDALNSLDSVPEAKGILPKENLVLSVEGSYTLLESLQLRGEYASTALTQDLRAGPSDRSGGGLAGLLLDGRASTEYYHAFNVGVNYSWNKSKLGVGYERIDPGYQTLGAYFFNNDFENITLNTSTSLLLDRLSVAVSIGYQRDDLKNQKSSATNRTVGSLNASMQFSQRLMMSASYSNFRTFTNVRANQFDDINDDDLTDEALEALDYQQLSQNANLSVNYQLSQSETRQQRLSFNYALADVSNEQGGQSTPADASTFHNFNTSYMLGYPKQSLTFMAGLNATINQVGTEDGTTWGPIASMNKRFYKNTLNTGLGISYNQSNGQQNTNTITNLRANAAYVWKKKHNFSLNAIQLFRSSDTMDSLSELTMTFGYSYSFSSAFGASKISKEEPSN